tara:strand:- start:512 stop:745 length:234 start_codon:yes stop_codon:yes gene_type:complete
MDYKIKFRIEESGDFFEQGYPNEKSIATALRKFRKLWMHESKCVYFRIESNDSVSKDCIKLIKEVNYHEIKREKESI